MRRRSCLLLLLTFLPLCLSHAQGDAPVLTAITTLPGDGFNMELFDQLTATRVNVRLTVPVHNWFAGQFANLPVGQQVSIGLSMVGNNKTGEEANVKKWVGLRPVMTYADVTQYEAYQWYRKDKDGRWRSGDPCKRGDAQVAGTGETPEQQIIPTALASQFLSPDGKFWCPWREIDTTAADVERNVFRITETFARPQAAVAMRPPYTYTFEQALVARLRAAKLAGVTVDDIGVTSGGRTIHVIRVDDPADPTPLTIGAWKVYAGGKLPAVTLADSPTAKAVPDRRVFLLTGREHATEHASSWVPYGTLCKLLDGSPEAARLRRHTTWLLVPMYDPDGCAKSEYATLTDAFGSYRGGTPVEVMAFARYLRAFVNSGRPIQATASFYNMEGGDCHLVAFSPFLTQADQEETLALSRLWFKRLLAAGMPTAGPDPWWGKGTMSFRLFGWVGVRYGAMATTYEINDRLPSRRLNLQELQSLGASFATSLVDFLETEQGQKRQQRTHDFLTTRANALAQYYQHNPQGLAEPTATDLLLKGY